AGRGDADATGGAADDPSTPAAEACMGSLADALEQGLAATRSGVLVQLDEDVRLADVVARAARVPPRSRPRGAIGTGAPDAWILHEGLRTIGGRLAIALFGDGTELLSDGASRLREVPGLRTGGGTAFAGDALELASDRLDMANPRRPRFAYCLSDGGWYDTA